MSECAMRSACTRCAPSATNISPTTDLPAAIPPVRPTFSMRLPKTVSTTEDTEDTEKSCAPAPPLCPPCPLWLKSRSRQLRHSLFPPHLRRLYRVEHQHRDGQRAHAARHGRECSGNFGDLGKDVADQRRSLLAKRLFPLGVSRKEALKLRRVGDGVHP